MICPNCRGAQLVEISLTLRDRQVTLHSCSKCDTRWWDCEGERIALQGVLDLAQVSR